MSLLQIPAQIGKTLWGFINPQRTAGRISLGRTAIVAQIVGAAIFLGYTLVKKDFDLPFSPERYRVEVIFPDAKGLDQADEPSAAVAGSPVGRVTDVEYENGRAIATLELEADIRGKLFADATVGLRPASALQNLLVNINPGSPEAGPLPDDVPIEPENTNSFVSIDELTSVFDADTQAYAQILITEAERGLRGRSSELSASLAKLGELTDTAKPVARALAQRRRLLSELVGHLDQTFETVALRGEQLGIAVDAGSRTLAVTAGREAELTKATRMLGPVVREAHLSLAATREIAEPLAPTLERLVPAARHLPRDARRLRRLIPRASRFVDQTDELTREGELPLSLLLTATEGLDAKAAALVPVAKDLTFRSTLLDQYKGGVPQLADTWSGAFSVSDNGGSYGQVDVLGIEPFRPENFGFASARAARSAGGGEGLDLLMAEALELSCKTQSAWACVVRFGAPGLPDQPVTATEGKG